jgi:hypothetical protein
MRRSSTTKLHPHVYHLLMTSPLFTVRQVPSAEANCQYWGARWVALQLLAAAGTPEQSSLMSTLAAGTPLTV